MRRFPLSRTEIVALIAAPAIAFAALRWLDPGLQFLMCEVLTLFLVAQMWNLLAGFAGQMSLGHQLFVGAGAYLLFWISNNTSLPVWLVLAMVPPIVAIAAIPLGLVMFPLKHAYFAVGMWVVAEIAQQVVFLWPALGGTSGMILRPGGQALRGFPEQVVLVIGILASIGLLIGLRLFLRTRLGLATLAMRDNERAAASAGVDVRRLHLLLFCLTGAGTAAAGAMYYTTTLYTSPLDAFQVTWVVSALFITVIGGIGTLTGPVLGTILLIGLRETLTAWGWSGGQIWIVLGVIGILTLLWMPNGLWPALHSAFQRLARRPLP